MEKDAVNNNRSRVPVIIKKLVFTLCCVFLLSVIAFTAGFIYLLKNPQQAGLIAGNIISKVSSYSVVIDELDFEISPLAIHCKGIFLKVNDGSFDAYAEKLSLPLSFSKSDGLILSIGPAFVSDWDAEVKSLSLLERGPVESGTIPVFDEIIFQGINLKNGNIIFIQEANTYYFLMDSFVWQSSGTISLDCNVKIDDQHGLLLDIPAVSAFVTYHTEGSDSIETSLSVSKGFIRGLNSSLNADMHGYVVFADDGINCTFDHMEIDDSTNNFVRLISDINIKNDEKLNIEFITNGNFNTKSFLFSDSLAEDSIKGEVSAKGIVDIGNELSETVADLEVDIKNITVTVKNENNSLDFKGDFSADAKVTGSFDNLEISARVTSDIESLKILEGDIQNSKIDVAVNFKRDEKLNIEFITNGNFNAKASLFSGSLTEESIKGEISAKGIVDIGNEFSETVADLEVNMKNLIGTVKNENNSLDFKGDLAVDAKVTGSFDNLEVSARITSDIESLKFLEVSIQNSKIDAAVNGKYPNLSFKELFVSTANLSFSDLPFDLSNMEIKAVDGKFNMSSGELFFKKLSASSDKIPNIIFYELTTNFSDDFSARLEGRGTIETVSALELIPLGWKFSGDDAFNLKITKTKTSPLTVSGNFRFENLMFQDEPGIMMGENIACTLESVMQYYEKGLLQISSKLFFPKGEILFDSLYFNFEEDQVSLTCNLEKDEIIVIKEIVLQIEDKMVVKANGNFSDNPITFSESKVFFESRFPWFYKAFLNDILSADKAFSEIEIGGNINASLDMSFIENNPSVSGFINWNNGMLNKGDSFSVDMIELSFPVVFGKTKEKYFEGKLYLEGFSADFIPSQTLLFNIKAEHNFLELSPEYPLQTAGGPVSISICTISNPYDDPVIVSGISFDDIDLEPFFSEFWYRPIKGSLKGELSPVSFEKGILRADGTLYADIFNGKIILHDFSAGNFDISPHLRVNDIEIENIDLFELTEGSSFGEVKGKVGGYIKKMEIVGKEPSGFLMLIETEKQKEVKQLISMKAVDSISQMGGGGGGMGGFALSFFKEFPYDKIGIKVSLQNDMFRVNGTVYEGGTEYLIKRGGLTGVNIVNSNPDNRISFNDMIRRIQRITKTSGDAIIR